MVKLLVDNGADMMTTAYSKWTPLSEAAGNGHIKVVKLLIDSEADVTVAAQGEQTPLYGASCNGTLGSFSCSSTIQPTLH